MEDGGTNRQVVFSWQADSLNAATVNIRELADMIESSGVDDAVIEPDVNGTTRLILDLSDTNIPVKQGIIYAGQLIFNKATISPENWVDLLRNETGSTGSKHTSCQIESVEYEDEAFILHFVDEDAPVLTVLPGSLELITYIDEAENEEE